MDEKIYHVLNKSWKSTTKILLGEEIGELKEYQDWLMEYAPRVGKRKSQVSGKDTTFVMDYYCAEANFVTSAEVKELSAPLDINQVKDIDSIIEGIRERWEYSGDKVLGNSTNVEASDAIINSHYIYESADVKDSTDVIASSVIQEAKYLFGCEGVEFSEFMIAFLRGAKVKRGFASHFTADASDVYCSSYCMGCHDILFSFNQRNKRNCIGNIELSKDKYQQLKSKLISEIKDELKKEKRFPSIFELVPNEAPDMNMKITSPPSSYEGDMEPIEKAFSTTCSVLLKHKPGSIIEYEDWLKRHLLVPVEIDSAFGRKALKSNIPAPIFSRLPEKRLTSYKVALELGSLKMDESDITSLGSIMEGTAKIGYFSSDLKEGTTHNIIKSAIGYNDSNIYKTDRVLMSEYIALSYLATECKYVFGSYRMIKSQFCIDCYQSENITRGFELDSCTNCADTMFSHNCEALNDAMFCFNTKGKRYTIGNNQLPIDKYKSVKASVFGQITDELERNRSLKWDIFNIGCGKPSVKA